MNLLLLMLQQLRLLSLCHGVEFQCHQEPAEAAKPTQRGKALIQTRGQ